MSYSVIEPFKKEAINFFIKNGVYDMKIMAKLSISGAMALGLIATGMAGVLISTNAHAIPGTDSNYTRPGATDPNLSNFEMNGGRDPNSVQTGMGDTTNSNLTGNNLNPTVGNPSNLGNPANPNLNRNSTMTGEQNLPNNNALGTQGSQVKHHHHHHHYYHHPKQPSTSTQKQQNMSSKNNLNANTNLGPSY